MENKTELIRTFESEWQAKGPRFESQCGQEFYIL